MTECLISSLRELTPSFQTAMLDCARFRPGTYVFKPQTMRKLSALGLASQVQGEAFCLTRDGADLVRAWKER
jgi:hypothetical protein